MKRTKSDAALTRAAILDAAELLFYREGVENSTLDQIAAQAGVTRGALYWHFRGKEDLLLELFAGLHVNPLQEIYEEDARGPAFQPLCFLEHKLHSWFDSLGTIPHLKRMFTILLRIDLQAEPGALKTVIRKLEVEERWATEFAFQRAAEQGLLGNGHSPETCSNTTRSLVKGFEREVLLSEHSDCVVANAKISVSSLFSSFRRDLTH
ncbi:TetR/AcrR family transcriptional regulator [Phyllobacterium sp. 22229]|uniref:TetR family transcriptional regulator n=1 Tax=Agrobacterium radiobacter TaxID=362 RepID=A0ABD5LKV1_AGRRD